jgi:DNA-binding IclR family transcriptional regulator
MLPGAACHCPPSWTALRTTRDRGYAVTLEQEAGAGLSVAMPVSDANGTTLGGVEVTIPATTSGARGVRAVLCVAARGSLGFRPRRHHHRR